MSNIEPDERERVVELYRRAWRVCAAVLRMEPRYRRYARFSVTQETFDVLATVRVKVAGIAPFQALADGSGFELFGLPLIVRERHANEPSWGITVEIPA